MNLILLEPEEIEGGKAVVSGHRAAHIRDVLGARPGGVVRIGVVNGPKGRGVVERTDGEHVGLRCELDDDIPPRPRVSLLLALPRPKVMKRLWAQLAALGVDRILLTNAWKVEKNYFDTHVLDPSFFRPLLVEGLQQAKDTQLPRVTVHRRFKVLVEDELEAEFRDDLRLVADPAADAAIGGLVSEGRPVHRVLMAIGPEGGWTDYELDLLGEHGFRRGGMGCRALRSDTACIALLAVIHAALRPDGGR